MKKLFYLAILPLLVLSCVFFAKCENKQINTKADRKISAILAEAGLGKNPLVLIDGKEYKPEKVDEIGSKNIGQARVVIHKGAGNNARGVVEISTKNGKIEQINISTYTDRPIGQKTYRMQQGYFTYDHFSEDPMSIERKPFSGKKGC